MSIKGFSVKTVTYVLTAVAFIAIVLNAYAIRNAYDKYVNVTDAYGECMVSLRAVESFSDASDYLTEQARAALVNMSAEYMHRYSDEILNAKRREHAMEILASSYGENDEKVRLLKRAYELSQQLIDPELHAMRLVAQVKKIGYSQLPDMLISYELPVNEYVYTNYLARTKAYKLIFGNDYKDVKNEVKQCTMKALRMLDSEVSENTSQKTVQMENALAWLEIYVISLFVIIVAIMMMTNYLVLNPVRKYEKAFEENKELEPTGSREIRKFALAYNKLYESNEARRNKLIKQAEHDVLTGVMNRQAYENIKEEFADSDIKLAFLLVDVDKFKIINDTYGHEVGDKALKKVTTLLKKYFRAEDYIFRIGGDEFAIIVKELERENVKIITDKIDSINDILVNTKDDVPSISLSVGITFSKEGLGGDVFTRADEALYEIKDAGRCGYRVSGK